jgi:hypothetical protein
MGRYTLKHLSLVLYLEEEMFCSVINTEQKISSEVEINYVWMWSTFNLSVV